MLGHAEAWESYATKLSSSLQAISQAAALMTRFFFLHVVSLGKIIPERKSVLVIEVKYLGDDGS